MKIFRHVIASCEVYDVIVTRVDNETLDVSIHGIRYSGDIGTKRNEFTRILASTNDRT